MKISVITPTFNRINLIERSIESSIHLLENSIINEIIIVDDASDDGTPNLIKSKYQEYINSGKIKLIELIKNIGVTGAKNIGAQNSIGDWLVFMDSDDYFLPGTGKNILNEINSHIDFDVIFFRCMDDNSKKVIGSAPEEREITPKQLINYGTPGECLPVLKKHKFMSFQYPTELRGCESLTYINMSTSGSKIFLSKFIVRGYRSTGNDRLSTRFNIIKRSDNMFRYNIKLLSHYSNMNFKTLSKTIIKSIVYGIASSLKLHKFLF